MEHALTPLRFLNDRIDKPCIRFKLQGQRKPLRVPLYELDITKFPDTSPPPSQNVGLSDFVGFCSPVHRSTWQDPREFPSLMNHARRALAGERRDITPHSTTPYGRALAFLMALLSRSAPGLSYLQLYDAACHRLLHPICEATFADAVVSWSYLRGVPLRFEGRRIAFVLGVAKEPLSRQGLDNLLKHLSSER